MVIEPNTQRAIQSNLTVIAALTTEIAEIEALVKSQMVSRPEFQGLLTIDGIGDILGLTIALETGDIHRFPTVGQFASYCRCVGSQRLSNGKSKGENNRKNGNCSFSPLKAKHDLYKKS